MIAGETEAIVHRYSEDYDEFFGLFKKKKDKKPRSPEEEAERKKKRAKFWSEVKTTITDLAQVAPLTEAGQEYHGEMPPPAIGYHRITEAPAEASKGEDEAPQKSSFNPTVVVGGVVLLLVVGYVGYTYWQKQNSAHAPTHPVQV